MEKVITYSFRESFIDNLTDYLERYCAHEKKDISRLAIVFGGKRPPLFVKRALSKRLGRNILSPRFFTIDEFVTYTVRKKEQFGMMPDLENCHLLYSLAKKKTPQVLQRRTTFVEFLPWAREILSFIEQLDLEHIDSAKLDKIKANAEIGYPVPEDINALLKNIVTLREEYHRAVNKKKIFSRGFLYRKAAEIAPHVAFDEFDQILFCNFFYFHHSEEVIVKSLFQRDKATLFFQGDERRWSVLKRISSKFGCVIQEEDVSQSPSFKLKLYSSFDRHAQVCLARDIIRDVKASEKNVIVLPDTENIVPLLSEINPVVKKYNISMGYPLKRSSLYSLLKFISQAQSSRKGDYYYTKDYLKVLQHPFVKNLRISQDEAVTRIFVHKIEEILR